MDRLHGCGLEVRSKTWWLQDSAARLQLLNCEPHFQGRWLGPSPGFASEAGIQAAMAGERGSCGMCRLQIRMNGLVLSDRSPMHSRRFKLHVSFPSPCLAAAPKPAYHRAEQKLEDNLMPARGHPDIVEEASASGKACANLQRPG